jgi:hypothetical protein
MKKLYTLLVIMLFGFVANAQVGFSYPTPICTYSTNISPILSPDFVGGGIFSSSPGLVINSVTGVIVPTISAPGTYLIDYTVPAGPPDFVSLSATFVVTITAPVVPIFAQTAPVCSGNAVPILPSASTNGIVGTWSPSTVDPTVTATYTFTPNFGECATSTSTTIIVLAPLPNPVITSDSGFVTVYVDANNNVIATLILASDVPNGFTSQWYEDGVLVSGATANTFTINTASPNGNDRVFTVQITNPDTGCSTLSTGFVVAQSSGTPPPNGPRMQTLNSGATLADIIVSGTGIQWYASAFADRNALATPLPLNTLLVDNTTYYATQTVNGSESLERLPVLVQLTLGIEQIESVPLNYSPNPVKNSLTIKASTIINCTSIYNMLGQLVKTSRYNQSEIVEDMSELTAGTYFIRVTSENRTEVFRVVKE